MPRFVSIRPVYCLFVTGLFVLGGCQAIENSGLLSVGSAPPSASASGGAEVEESEDLLGADGEVAIVDEGRVLSPIEQHMLARKDVNPKKINRKNKFSKTVEEYKAHEKDHSRTVRVEADAEKLAGAAGIAPVKGLKIDADTMKNQQNAKSYVEAVLARHKARQAQASMDNKPVASGVKATARVRDVRVGEHPGKTRIVIDVSDKARFHTYFEDDNTVLVVKMPNVGWSAQVDESVDREGLVSGYRGEDSGAGAVVKIALSAPATLAYQKAFAPSEGRGNRIVLDVVAR